MAGGSRERELGNGPHATLHRPLNSSPKDPVPAAMAPNPLTFPSEFSLLSPHRGPRHQSICIFVSLNPLHSPPLSTHFNWPWETGTGASPANFQSMEWIVILHGWPILNPMMTENPPCPYWMEGRICKLTKNFNRSAKWLQRWICECFLWVK